MTEDSPVLIAECCQNHNGDTNILKEMVHAAAEAGADYVKIQSMYSSLLTHRQKFDEGRTSPDGQQLVIKRPYSVEKERLAKLDLSLEVEQEFIAECQRAGIKSMTTPFARVTVPQIAPLGYDAVKVASYDCGSLPFLTDIANHWDTVVVSTGATTDEEIAAAAGVLNSAGKTFYLLHCVTIYPTPVHEMHLSRLDYLRMFCPLVGLSSHPKADDDRMVGDKIALAMGANCIERHFTVLDRSESRDGPVSMNPSELAELRAFAELSRPEQCEWVRREVPNWPDYLGVPTRELSEVELLNRDYYRGRFASPGPDGTWIYNWE